MNKAAVILFALLAIASVAHSQLDCANLPVAFYCDGTGFALCVNGNEYNYACAAGTACQCGQGVECDTPCTMACETGDRDTDAYNYCQARLNDFAGLQQGYFCDALGGGFYQCVRDAYCPESASPQSQYQYCPDGTMCACGDTYKECSLAASRTPCLYNTSYVPLTTQPLTTQPLSTQSLTTHSMTTQAVTSGQVVQPLTTQSQTVQSPHQASLCGSYRWDCINFSQGYSAHSCVDNSCGDVGDGGYCFWDLGTNTGACAGNMYCNEVQSCNSEAECPPDYMCLINTCCGAGGICGPVCNT